MAKLIFVFLLLVLFHQEVSLLGNKACISTLHEFQQSLVNRSVNLDSLNAAFSPPNRQASISFVVRYYFCSHSLNANSTTKVLCSDIEKWADDKNAGRDSEVDFSEEVKYKFLWNASPINLFIRPNLLESLSLYTFRTEVRNTSIILDQLCETLIWPGNTTKLVSTEESSKKSDYHDPLEACSNPLPILTLLEKLTANLKSFYLHKQSFFTQGIKADGNEKGYPSYYFNPDEHVTDVCILNQVADYEEYRMLLSSAILLTQILIPFVIPFSGRMFHNRIQKQIRKRESNFKHYLRGFFMSLILLCTYAFIGNSVAVATEEKNDISKSSFSDVHNNYVIGAIIMCAVNPINTFVNISYNCCQMQKDCCIFCQCCFCCCKYKQKFWFTMSIVILVVTASFLSFNAVYIFMGMIAAPIETGSLIFFYSTVFFLLTMTFTITSKGWSYAWKQLGKERTPTSQEQPRIPLELPVYTEDSVSVNVVSPEDSTCCSNFFNRRRSSVQQEQPPTLCKRFKNYFATPKWSRCCLICDIVIGFMIVVFVVGDMALYLTFYYQMAIKVEPYSSSAGFLSSFGSLVPAIFTLTVGLLEKRFISFISGPGNDNTEGADEEGNDGNNGPRGDENNGGARNTGEGARNTGEGETNTGGGETNTGGGETNTGGGETNTGGGETNTGGGETNTGGGETNTGGGETNTGEGERNTGGETNTGGGGGSGESDDEESTESAPLLRHSLGSINN